MSEEMRHERLLGKIQAFEAQLKNLEADLLTYQEKVISLQAQVLTYKKSQEALNTLHTPIQNDVDLGASKEACHLWMNRAIMVLEQLHQATDRDHKMTLGIVHYVMKQIEHVKGSLAELQRELKELGPSSPGIHPGAGVKKRRTKSET